MFDPGVCVLHVEASATGRSLVYGVLLDVCVCVCVCDYVQQPSTSKMGEREEIRLKIYLL